MATQNNNQNQSRPWQAPRYESPEEKARREEREANSRYLIDTMKQAMDEYFTERADAAKANKKKDPIAALLGME